MSGINPVNLFDYGTQEEKGDDARLVRLDFGWLCDFYSSCFFRLSLWVRLTLET